jgi:hypothetical protein
MLKRFLIWLFELGCIAIGLGLLLRLLWGSLPDGKIAYDIAQYVLAAMVVFIWGSGYFLTTLVFAVTWRSSRSWVYPVIAAALYTVHLQLFATGWGAREKLPLQISGALLVFACTFVGGWILNRWQKSSRLQTRIET